MADQQEQHGAASRYDSYIQFLGTGAADCHDSPEFPHRLQRGESAALRIEELGGKNVRRYSSLYIAPDIVVDFTSHDQLRAHDVPEEWIRHILYTHAHPDHFQPRALLRLLHWASQPINVYASPTVLAALQFAAQYEWDPPVANFRVRPDWPRQFDPPPFPVNPGDAFAVGSARVSAVLANHQIDAANAILAEPALNFVFQRNGKALLYALDSAYFLPGSFEILSRFQFDIAVFDGTFGTRDIDPAASGHQNVAMLEDTVQQFRDAGLFRHNAKIVASHIYSEESHADLANLLAAKGIMLAYDGMRIDF
ncbi:MAG: MBL fold metallo-hydrolase [Candidatus Hydrogenedentes bacterium]|nr:MBL fold metallo-hydrolase [Candidatus Hydrogenedentota bacterium]